MKWSVSLDGLRLLFLSRSFYTGFDFKICFRDRNLVKIWRRWSLVLVPKPPLFQHNKLVIKYKKEL